MNAQSPQLANDLTIDQAIVIIIVPLGDTFCVSLAIYWNDNLYFMGRII
jgi:hypothetical protein